MASCSEALSTRSVGRAGVAPSSSSPIHHPRLPVPPTTAASLQFQPPRRALSASSHGDFSPQKKHDVDGADDDAILGLIDSHVKSNRIMLYMKGNPSQPMCGFSATVVGILKASGADFSSVNVLDYPEVREGVKKYAQWPTIPQLYVDGEFVGGCDIVQDMDKSGELKELLAAPEEGEEKKGD